MNVSELWLKAVQVIYTLQAVHDETDGGLFINDKLQQFIYVERYNHVNYHIYILFCID